MKVLVTGACGFIGYELAKKLDKLGHDVIAFVHHESKRARNSFNVPTVVGDIRNPEDLDQVGKIDCIHHLAAHSDPVDFSVDMMETNVIGTRNVLEMARRHKAKVVFVSSSAVYGNLAAPYSEAGGIQPLNAYGTSKSASEYFCKAYVEKHHLDIVILRYFNTYGIGEEIKGKDASMIFQFIQSLLKKNFVEIYGDGRQNRDFIYVKDSIEANVLAMNGNGFSGRVFNVGTGLTINYNELVHKIETQLGRPIEIKYIENPIKEYYQFHTQADVTHSLNILSFKPKYSLEEGIQEVIQHYAKV